MSGKKRLNCGRHGAFANYYFVSKHQGLRALLTEKKSAVPAHGISLLELLRRPELTYEDLLRLPETPDYPEEIKEQLDIQVRYQGYIEKQEAQVRQFIRLEQKPLPDDLDYEAISGLSLEAREKLSQRRPESIGQAQRITGVTPADISVLLIYLGQKGEGKDGELSKRIY